MSWTPPDPFITEKNWDEYPPEAQVNMVNVNGKGVIRCWDKYFLELKQDIWDKEEKLGLTKTTWQALISRYPPNCIIWDKHMEEIRTAIENLCTYLYTGETYRDILQKYYGYTNWCNGEPLSNNYIWDRCIDEARRCLDSAILPKEIITIMRKASTTGTKPYGSEYGWPELYQDCKNEYINNPTWSVYSHDPHSDVDMPDSYLYTDYRFSRDFPNPDEHMYNIIATQCFLRFDTRSISNIQYAKLILPFHVIKLKDTSNPVLLIFAIDTEETIGPEHWFAGQMISRIELTPNDSYTTIEIPLNTMEINIGGYSTYRLGLEIINNTQFFPEPSQYCPDEWCSVVWIERTVSVRYYNTTQPRLILLP